jgi:hypothetical protein
MTTDSNETLLTDILATDSYHDNDDMDPEIDTSSCGEGCAKIIWTLPVRLFLSPHVGI